MNYINLTDAEARNITSPYIWLVVLKEQPPDDAHIFEYKSNRFTSALEDTWYYTLPNQQHELCDDPQYWFEIKLPHAVGDIVGCKETWAYDWVHHANWGIYKKVIYKADTSEEKRIHYSWRSPVTMPRGAIRKWLKIKSVDCKRVQDILVEERVRLYPLEKNEEVSAGWFQDWFNSLHAKSLPVKEHGKIVSYVAYLYDDTPESRTYLTKVPNFDKYRENIDIEKGDVLGYYDIWKGLPLKIIANPYLLLCVGKEVANATVDN